jgi:hypothetical protein
MKQAMENPVIAKTIRRANLRASSARMCFLALTYKAADEQRVLRFFATNPYGNHSHL